MESSSSVEISHQVSADHTISQNINSNSKKKTLAIGSYKEQRSKWPKEGKVILAQYDEESVRKLYESSNRLIDSRVSSIQFTDR
jgi:hypothetical protein